MSLKRFIFILLIYSGRVPAGTLPVALQEGNSRFLSRALGTACYTLDSVQRGLPCNPAFVAKERAPRFDGDFVLGTQAAYLQEAENILHGRASEAQVADFFSHRETIEAEASLEFSFQTPKWGVAWEPYRLIAVTRFENPALPMVDIVIAEERTIKAQIASYMQDNFYAGLQVRYTQVRFIGDYFSLSDAFAGDREQLWTPETQDLVYLEPGLVYAWEDVVWQPQISVMFAQWGVSSDKNDVYAIRPQGLLGASMKPVIPLGVFEAGLQVQLQQETQNFRDAFRVAFSYQLGILQTVMSLSEYDRSAGFLLSYKNFSTGLSYWDENDSRGVFMQLGVSL